LEDRASFRVQTAALSRPAAPAPAHANMVVIADGESVVVHTPSRKLAILAARR
jgi:hypothetical protein